MENSDARTDTIEVHLELDEALVLFELLSRWCDPKTNHTPDPRCFESAAEGAVLHGLLADLETKLVAPFKPEYNQLLENARKRLAGKQDDLGRNS